MEEDLAKKSFEQPKKVFGWEILLFLLTLGLGVLNGYRISRVMNLELIEAGQTNLVWLGIYFIIGTLILVGLSSWSKAKRARGVVFKVLFVLAVSTGALLLFQMWFSNWWGLALLMLLVVLWATVHSVVIHDLLVMLGIAGAGSWLGLNFTPRLVVLLLVIFSVYDFIAVYKTKHMVKMAKAMVEAESIVGLIVPARIKDFTKDIGEIQPGGKFLIVGGGDVVFPLILCVSFIPLSLSKALIMMVFSLLGVGLSFWVFTTQKIKKPIPALPPISLGAIMGYLVTLLI